MTDPRLFDARIPVDSSVTASKLAIGAVTSAAILDGTIVDADVAAANKDGAAGTPSLRTLSTTATTACAGNDSRLSDTRTPTDGSVTLPKFSSTVRPITLSSGAPGSPTVGDFYWDSTAYTFNEYTTATTGFRAPWNMPWGYITSTSWTTNSSTTAGPIDVTNATVTFNGVQNRRYRYSIAAYSLGSVATDITEWTLTDGSNAAKGTPSLINLLTSPINIAAHQSWIAHESYTAASGSITRKLRLRRLSGTGTVQCWADATRIAFWLVEDIGPSANPA